MTRTGDRDVVVTGLGMITAVGPGVVSSCAAIRAGLSRPRELVGGPLLVDPDSGDEGLVFAHAVENVAEGFMLVGAWESLALQCLDDLVDYAALPSADDTTFWRETGLLVAVPADLAARFGEGSDDLTLLQEAYVEPLTRVWGRSLASGFPALVPAGQAGAIAAIEQATRHLGESTCRRVVVLAADSFLDPLSIEWLRASGRLRAPDLPVGVAPGEAAACVLLETHSGATRRNAPIEAILDGVAIGRGEREDLDGRPLADAIRSAARGRDRSEAERGVDLVTDLDGQMWRARMLGAASVVAAGELVDSTLFATAASTGHVGAASALIGIGHAVRHFVRCPERPRSAIVTAASEDGQVGAACFSRVPQGNR